MKRELVYVNEYQVDIDYSVEPNLKSFKEEVLNRLYAIHKENLVNDLLFSGGMDSTFLLKSLQELGITPKLHSLSFAKDLSDYGSIQAKSQAKKFGVEEPEFFYVDKYEFFKHVDFLTFERKIAYPAMHCYYMDYYLSLMEGMDFFCGMSCEFRTSHGVVTLNTPPAAIKFYNPHRLYGYDNSETFLAFVNHPMFKDNYLKPNPSNFLGENVWHIRDLIYSDCYPEMGIIPKQNHEDSYIAVNFFEQKLPPIKNLYPIIFMTKPFKFDAKAYHAQKEQK